jgi:Tfp pilus assembly protein PilZ
MDNRRLGMERLRVEYPVRYWTQLGKNKQAGLVLNVCSGGLFVHCPEPERQGQKITMEVDIPGKSAIRLRGSVAWSRKMPKQFARPKSSGFGLIIEHAPEEWFQQLASLMTFSLERQRRQAELQEQLPTRR